MKLVLLERVENLGAMGDVVTVRPGFARNYLLPQEKALRATEANMARFEAEREALEKRVALMSDGSMEADMLDERARLNLNLVHANELVVLRPGHRYNMN